MVGELRNGRQQFLDENKCVNAAKLDAYISSVIEHNKRGVSLYSAAVPNWSFGQSFFFSGTVITTIGYGQQTPLSTSGKMFCMLYALIGIPFTLMVLRVLVEHLMVPTNSLLSFMNTKLGHLYRPFYIRLMHLSLISGIVFTLFLLIPTAVLDYIEPVWNWFDSFYYCFISLTTVGLGDFIPGDDPHQSARSAYKTFVTVYLVLGLTAVMLAVNVFTSIPELDLTAWFRNECASVEEDPERQRLQVSGSLYSEHLETPVPVKKEQRRVVRARSRREDTEDYDDQDDTPVLNGP